MTDLRLLTFLALFGLLIVSCKKEKDLTKEKSLAASQQSGIDFLNEGGEADLGGNTTVKIKEIFEATVDGASRTYTTSTYSESGFTMTMTGTDNTHSLRFSVSKLTVSGDTINLGDPQAGQGIYVPGIGQEFPSHVGQLIVDTSNVDFLSGSFYFRAKNRQNSRDSVVVTNGKFRVAKKS